MASAQNEPPATAVALAGASATGTPPPPSRSRILGVLGGSGLYEISGLTDREEREVDTPFGPPSGPLLTGRLDGAPVVFLARHGRGHRFSPSEINYRANIHAMKQLGVGRLLSVSAVGSLREGIPPGDLVLVDQFIDRTHRRVTTFFGDGVVGHVSFAEPTCAVLTGAVAAAASVNGHPLAEPTRRHHAPVRRSGGAAPSLPALHRGGTYVCMEGPQFSTRAESLLHRDWGADVIGMTAACEAKLAREAELCFSLLALSTDYDAWREGEEAVTAESIIAVLTANVARAERIVHTLAPHAAAVEWDCPCGRAAERAILTARAAVTPAARARLVTLYGRYL